MSKRSARPIALVVEDDAIQRMVIVEALSAFDFDVIDVEDGAMAVMAFSEHHPDVVLLDVVMPVSDGFEVCRRLRDLPGGVATPIVMMTGLDDAPSIDAAFDAGATDFITKPVNPFLLGHRMRYLLRAADAFRTSRDTTVRLSRTQQMARIAQWSVDLATGRFSWSGNDAELLGIRTDVSESVDALLHAIHPDDRVRVAELLDPPVAHRADFRVVGADGVGRVVHQEAEIVLDDQGRAHLVGATQDVSELREAERRIHHLANFDPVTGLPNRTLLIDFLRDAKSRSCRSGRLMAILSIDLDLFKRVNDTLGHAAGDTLLREVGQRLAASIRDNEHGLLETMTARLSGDEFAVALSELRSHEEAAGVATRIGERLAASFDVGGHELFVSASVGISTCDGGGSVEALLEQADAAMHQVKENGRNGYQFFSAQIQERARKRLDMENRLRAAVSRMRSDAPEPCEFELHYQPKVELPGLQVGSVEALLRWKPKEGGFVSPAEFIPVAEDAGLIVALGEWVLRRACLTARSWARDGRVLRMGVNVSANQFLAPGFVSTVASALDESGLDPEQLELEITEGTVMTDGATGMRVLGELKALGVRIALDDFGTGYSSLGYLTRLPIDVLKIDRSFVKSMGTSPKVEIITAAILSLSRGLGIEVVAEGVETESQLAFFRGHAPVEIQGFYFAKPMPESTLGAWLTAFALRRQEDIARRVTAAPASRAYRRVSSPP